MACTRTPVSTISIARTSSADADEIRQSHDHIHGTHKGRPDADKIPAKAMHGTHKGRLTPTIYPRNPWYSCKSMACTRLEGDDLTVPTLLHNFLFSAGPLCLLTRSLPTTFFSAGPLCFWTRSLPTTFFFAGPLCLWTRSLTSCTTFFSAGPLCFWTRSLPTTFFFAGPLCLWTRS
ncbi:hypothetical protein EV363DRAFT_1331810, partial [Boletus edulis]